LISANLYRYLETYQVKIDSDGRANGSGWIYVLSTRDKPRILKIGMTERSVAERVGEINSATGVLIPFSARRVFRVRNAVSAERDIHRMLDEFRIRSDREFFEMSFQQAAHMIESYLEEARQVARKSGIVTSIYPEHGYGFIATEREPNVFVHFSGIEPDDREALAVGVRVEFDLGQTPRGMCALDVHVDRGNW